MVEITLFEFNLESVDLTANAPFSAQDGPEGAESDAKSGILSRFRRSKSTLDEGETIEVSDEEGGSSPIPVLVGLVLLVVFVVVGRRIMGGEPEPVPE